MGARELKSLAQKFLTSSEGDKLAVRLQAVEAEKVSLQARIASLEEQLAALAAKGAPTTAPAPADAPKKA